MRLIDADKLLENYDLKSCDKHAKDTQTLYHSMDTLMMYEIKDMIEDAPTVVRWIPVTKALPPEDTWVLATVKDPDGKKSVRRVTCVKFHTTLWEDETMSNYPVIAWMPLLEPYEGE